jgi:hypothetical protein
MQTLERSALYKKTRVSKKNGFFCRVIKSTKRAVRKQKGDLARIIDATEHLQDSARWFSMRFSLFDDEATFLTLILKGRLYHMM